MGKKLIIIIVLIISTFFYSCDNKSNSKIQLAENKYDTIYNENSNSVDTILLSVKNPNKSIWTNKIVYKKQYKKQNVMIAYSLSDNNYIFIDNINGKLNKKILGSEIELEKKTFKDYDLIKIENKSYNSGSLINSVNVFYINNNLKSISNEEFFVSSTDDGKTFDKKIQLIQNSDTIYYKLE